MTEPLVDDFLQLRRGPDGIDGTADDAKFKSLDEVRTALQLYAAAIPSNGRTGWIQRSGLSGSLAWEDRARRHGRVQMVVRKGGAMPQMITWKEF